MESSSVNQKKAKFIPRIERSSSGVDSLTNLNKDTTPIIVNNAVRAPSPDRTSPKIFRAESPINEVIRLPSPTQKENISYSSVFHDFQILSLYFFICIHNSRFRES